MKFLPTVIEALSGSTGPSQTDRIEGIDLNVSGAHTNPRKNLKTSYINEEYTLIYPHAKNTPPLKNENLKFAIHCFEKVWLNWFDLFVELYEHQRYILLACQHKCEKKKSTASKRNVINLAKL